MIYYFPLKMFLFPYIEMSYTEFKSREGLPYGSIPYDLIARKQEETILCDKNGNVIDIDPYIQDKYIRSEIIDWSSDSPFLESDRPRRDPSTSKSIINLRYGGTRGSRPELPRHPELFYGFTGNDPRGSDNIPRFDQTRGHITSRASNLTVSMGDNDDHHDAERPWTNQSISYSFKDIHKRVKDNSKIFSIQREGRPLSKGIISYNNVAQKCLVGSEDFNDTKDSSVIRRNTTYKPVNNRFSMDNKIGGREYDSDIRTQSHGRQQKHPNHGLSEYGIEDTKILNVDDNRSSKSFSHAQPKSQMLITDYDTKYSNTYDVHRGKILSNKMSNPMNNIENTQIYRESIDKNVYKSAVPIINTHKNMFEIANTTPNEFITNNERGVVSSNNGYNRSSHVGISDYNHSTHSLRDKEKFTNKSSVPSTNLNEINKFTFIEFTPRLNPEHHPGKSANKQIIPNNYNSEVGPSTL